MLGCTNAAEPHRQPFFVPRGVAVSRAFAPILMVLFFSLPLRTAAQGETTSAILGQVTDPSGASIAGAMVTITKPRHCAQAVRADR